MKLEPILKPKSEILKIAGPCSAETMQQVFQTAELLLKTGNVDIFRCGVWKHRSLPNSFSGEGLNALKWLQSVEKELHLPVCIEVASAKQLESALQFGIKYFWIGARTAVNPDLVQEIANQAKGTDIAMMIKNPLSPDLQLWYGHFERFYEAGITKLAAIYRGFTNPYPHLYRNDPAWQLLVDFERKYPEIPFIFDPSHIAGKTDLIPALAQKALHFNAKGLMVEVHANPKEALSDKEQQLTVVQYAALWRSLTIPKPMPQTQQLLQNLRVSIDNVDTQLIELLVQRFELVKEIAKIKKQENLPIVQVKRWEEVLQKVETQALSLGLDTVFVREMFELLHESSIVAQE